MLTVIAVPLLSTPDDVVKTNGTAAAVPKSLPTTTLPPPVVVPPIVVETQQVRMEAQSLRIDVGGKAFTGSRSMEVNSDPGNPQYTTLELEWKEQEVSMRMNIYFTSDGKDWWSDEVRTYNGAKEGDWAYYRGDFFRSPLGTPFVGDLDRRATGESGSASGRLRLTGLRLEAFRRPAACTNPSSPYSLQSGRDGFEMTLPGPGNGAIGYGVSVALLDTATCQPVLAAQGIDYRWTTENPAVVTITANGEQADVMAEGAGTTFVAAAAVSRSTGQTIADTKIKVDVYPAGQDPPSKGPVPTRVSPPRVVGSAAEDRKPGGYGSAGQAPGRSRVTR